MHACLYDMHALSYKQTTTNTAVESCSLLSVVNMLPVAGQMSTNTQMIVGLHILLLFRETQFITIMEPPLVPKCYFYLKQQVLGQVTPKPTEVVRASALRFPDLNRSLDFLPCENNDNSLQILL